MGRLSVYRGSKEVAQQYERLLADNGIPSTMGESALQMRISTMDYGKYELYVSLEDASRAREILSNIEASRTGRVQALSKKILWQFLVSLVINTSIVGILWVFFGLREEYFWIFFPGLIITMAVVGRVKQL